MSADDEVRAQYERWPYPLPVDDLGAFPFEAPGSQYQNLRSNFFGYWPGAAGYREDLDILVAGCGTFAGAVYAHFYPGARVTAIDISAASLEHEAGLKAKHGLSNLRLEQLEIEGVASLGQKFDFVSVMGVLHHLRRPEEGLRALGNCLREDGVLAGMVYARYGRHGVQMMQELFRMLSLGQDASDVQAVRDGLAATREGHPVRDHVARMRPDSWADTALVDTFLHRRERTFTVAECIGLVEAAGLAFQGWEENFFYHPELTLAEGHPFRERLDALDERGRWAAAELLAGNLACHFFHACRAERAVESYRVQFDGVEFLGWTPVLRAERRARGQDVTLRRAPFPEVELDAKQSAVVRAIEAGWTVGGCLRAAGIDPSQEPGIAYGRNLFRSLWRFGYVVFRWRAQDVETRKGIVHSDVR